MENKKELTQSEKIDLKTTEISRLIKKQLKEEFPKCNFSAKTEYYSMGCRIDLYLMKSDRKIIRDISEISDCAILGLGTSYTREDIKKRQEENNHQLNQFTLRDDFKEDNWCNGVFLTSEGFKLLKRAVEIQGQYNYNNSDSQTDYYNVNFSFSIGLGKWNKPFEDFKEEEEKEEENPQEKIKVVDVLTKKTFVFRNHEDKEEFFDLWDKVVLEVLD